MNKATVQKMGTCIQIYARREYVPIIFLAFENPLFIFRPEMDSLIEMDLFNSQNTYVERIALHLTANNFVWCNFPANASYL